MSCDCFANILKKIKNFLLCCNSSLKNTKKNVVEITSDIHVDKQKGEFYENNVSLSTTPSPEPTTKSPHPSPVSKTRSLTKKDSLDAKEEDPPEAFVIV